LSQGNVKHLDITTIGLAVITSTQAGQGAVISAPESSGIYSC